MPWQGMELPEIACLVGVSVKLGNDYLRVYEQTQGQPHQMEKLEDETLRLNGLNKSECY